MSGFPNNLGVWRSVGRKLWRKNPECRAKTCRFRERPNVADV